MISTGCKASEAEIIAAYRHIDAIEVFPESAIPATNRQNAEWTNPRRFYADILKRCLKCRRKYIFFAREQQFWYEELQINLATPSKYCCECAVENRDIEAAYDRYQRLSKLPELSDDQLLQIADDVLLLYKEGNLRKFDRLGEIKNQLIRRKIPEIGWLKLKTYLETGK